MGATGWTVRAPWAADLAEALAVARGRVFAEIPAADRERAAASSDRRLLSGLDLDPDDEDAVADWTSFVAAASPETRFALAAGPSGTGSILDVDHVVAEALRSATLGGGPWRLVRVRPSLAAVRWATDAELTEWFETPRPTRAQVDDPDLDLVELVLHAGRDAAVAIPCCVGDVPTEIVFVGVTGD